MAPVGGKKGHEMAPKGMACKEFVELVTEYLDGALSPEDSVRFEEHLALCDGCSIYLEQMRRTIGLLGHLPEESIPPAAQEELLQAFRNWKSHNPAA
jgi:predicted anti-sigma-YlaC factor YlaD